LVEEMINIITIIIRYFGQFLNYTVFDIEILIASDYSLSTVFRNFVYCPPIDICAESTSHVLFVCLSMRLYIWVARGKN